jgi:hypothetical protein
MVDDTKPPVAVTTHGREIERRHVFDHGTTDWRDGCVHQNTAPHRAATRRQ